MSNKENQMGAVDAVVPSACSVFTFWLAFCVLSWIVREL
jgi:hypothetical protein